jgi:tripartite-type tricarboxylate transporter receptor subunit TctC
MMHGGDRMTIRFTRVFAAAAGILAAAVPALAQQPAPARPLTIVVPYPAGGVTDTMARLIGEKMQDILGQTVIIESVGGGAGAIGVGRVARSAPDGLTLILGNLETNVTNVISQPLNFDVFKDFDPVAMMPSYPYLIVSKNDVPAKTLPELVSWLSKNQDKAFQGTVGAGSIQHLCGLRMQEKLGLKWSFVPYRGGAAAMQDLLGGRFDIMCTATGSFLPLVRNGQIRAYAITAPARAASAPDIPTVDEAGLPGLYDGVWNGIWAPKGTPKPVIDKLNAAAVAAMADPDFRKRITDLALEMPPADQLTPEALAALQKAETEKWWPIIAAAGIKKAN